MLYYLAKNIEQKLKGLTQAHKYYMEEMEKADIQI